MLRGGYRALFKTSDGALLVRLAGTAARKKSDSPNSYRRAAVTQKRAPLVAGLKTLFSVGGVEQITAARHLWHEPLVELRYHL